MLTIQIPENSTLDEDNNQNEISNELELNYDIIKPMIQNISVVSNTDSWWFVDTFIEEVLNFDIADFELAGTASNALTISSITAMSKTQYKVNVSDVNMEIGIVSLKVKNENDITDINGNTLVLSDFEAYYLNNEVLSIEDNFILEDISITPNPFVNHLKVSLKEGALKTVAIYNINGKVVFLRNSDQKKMIIDLGSMAQGTYFF